MTTLDHCSDKTKVAINSILDSDEVHFLTKDIIRVAITKDPVDAYHDVLLAVKALDAILHDDADKLG